MTILQTFYKVQTHIKDDEMDKSLTNQTWITSVEISSKVLQQDSNIKGYPGNEYAASNIHPPSVQQSHCRRLDAGLRWGGSPTRGAKQESSSSPETLTDFMMLGRKNK